MQSVGSSDEERGTAVVHSYEVVHGYRVAHPLAKHGSDRRAPPDHRC